MFRTNAQKEDRPGGLNPFEIRASMFPILESILCTEHLSLNPFEIRASMFHDSIAAHVRNILSQSL